jgi:hypothetical protein
MLYFLADEATMAAATASAPAASSASLTASSQNFGVRSLQESVSDSDLRRERRQPVAEEQDDEEVEDEEEDDELDARSMASLSTATQDFMSGLPSPKTNLSVPLTPVLGPSIAPSPITSPLAASRTNSDGEADDYMGGGGPQLIMPQIVIPSRRPFTEKGKRIGRLKMLIAGDSGILPPSLFIQSLFLYTDFRVKKVSEKLR